MKNYIFTTQRLKVRKADATPKDIDFFVNLWNNPKVMKNVGFPQGLNTNYEKIEKQIQEHDNSEFDQKLIVELKNGNTLIGECKLGLPDKDGISETDVKLAPEFWGHKYGVELKKALVDYLFTHTECIGVKATPNKKNIASQKMQEAVGGVRIEEFTYEFPEHMKHYTETVHGYVYIVYRETWEQYRVTFSFD